MANECFFRRAISLSSRDRHGMNRSGAPWREIDSLVSVVRDAPPDSVFTHFHSAELDDGSVAIQTARFKSAITALGRRSRLSTYRQQRRGGTLRDPLGCRYGPGSRSTGRRATLQSRLSPSCDFRRVSWIFAWIEPGDTVSYCATYTARASRADRNGGDGVCGRLSHARCRNRAHGSLNGVPIPQRGLVTMDMTMFDVTAADCSIGDVVTVIGDGSDAAPTVNAAAALASHVTVRAALGNSGSRLGATLSSSAEWLRRTAIIVLDGVGVGAAADASPVRRRGERHPRSTR